VSGWNAIVTGAGRGTGQAIALKLGQAGAEVVAVDVNPDSAGRAAAAIVAAGGAARAEVVDVSNKMAVQTLLYRLLEVWERIDVLVNAAHVTPHSPALKMDEWEWNRTLDVNLKSCFLMAQTAARAMQVAGGGVILNVIRPAGAASQAGVWAARGGLLGLSDALRSEWAPLGVRVYALEVGDPAWTADEVLRLCLAARPPR
jgi:NAD(P)-dependent dehydrogenase (short-subunit alcohol dehydrogenase family)